ncbi:MAG TPA: ribonuclease H-like domain-containing protein [Candidatus Lokiarchaeia archaeon]|nr:ribonuclease H-like domain-containing protein [Candidatus Lokiarchaeia archaeon]
MSEYSEFLLPDSGCHTKDLLIVAADDTLPVIKELDEKWQGDQPALWLYNSYLATGGPRLREEIQFYNEADVEITWTIALWLHSFCLHGEQS